MQNISKGKELHTSDWDMDESQNVKYASLLLLSSTQSVLASNYLSH